MRALMVNQSYIYIYIWFFSNKMLYKKKKNSFLYILREFKKLVITSKNIKNISNLIK